MSKLAALVAIPLGLLALKRIQKEIPDTPTPKPTGFTMGPAGTNMTIEPFDLFVSLPGLGGTRPTGPLLRATGPTVPLGMDTDVVPIFPDTAAGAAEEFAAKKPFEFGAFPKIGDISSLDFQTGLFDPAVQARLRAQK